MTRVLSELLNATEPLFSKSLQQLERLAGHTSTDIRLTSDIQSGVRTTLPLLRLDATDTTGHELYAALGHRLAGDEQRFAAAVLRGADGGDIVAHVVKRLQEHLPAGQVYAMKHTAARRILKAQVPRRTMKLLGYRSVDSMLRQESPAALIAAARLVESEQWNRKHLAAYAKLSPTDFESRQLTIEHPSHGRWQSIGDQVVAASREYVQPVRECGGVVILPLPAEHPRYAALLTAALALHAANEVRAAASFVKLQQLQPGFGKLVQVAASGAALALPTAQIDQPVPWRSLHRFLAARQGSQLAVFEPMLSASELAWHSVEQVLERIEPTLEFWHGTAYLGLLHRSQAVSLNLTDALLSHVNQLPYESRLVQYLQDSLQTELLTRYLNHDKLEQTVLATIHAQLAPELASAE